MTATRSRKEAKTYKEYLKTASNACVFCSLSQPDPQVLKETKNFKIVHNIFSYSLWDSQDVADHLMIVPKAHTDTLKDLSPLAAQEYVKLISEYETKSYNIYARAPSSDIKTVSHQHTHLIKPKGKARRFVFLLRKPYIRFVLG